MKFIKKALVSVIVIIVITITNSAILYAADNNTPDVPVLTSISFSGAEVDGKFSSNTYSYSLILDSSKEVPVIASYKPENLKVNVVYDYDDTHHPTGIIVTVSNYDSIEYSTYFFSYANLDEYETNSNNLISSISCENCELYPAINNEDTEYTLYTPFDLTEIELSVVTQDINAYCTYGGKIACAQGQELSIPITVTASNGEQRQYKVNVVRLDKTVEEVKSEMSKENFTSLIDGKKFYQKKNFKVIIVASVSGIVLLSILIAITKKIAIKIYDADDVEFFEIENINNNESENI